MNYLRFNHKQQSDNEGTFWPGYIEIPEEIQEEIVEAIREQIVAEKIENYKTENGLGESDEVDQSVVDGFTNEVASTPVNLQETLEISPDLDLSDYTL